MDTRATHEDARYEVRGQIGAGGFAKVYEAFDRVRGHLVALKVADARVVDDDAAILRMQREARAAMAINHPNVCAVLDAGTLDDGHSYVAMELLRGETLRSYLERHGASDDEEIRGFGDETPKGIDAELAIEIGAQILAGLEAAHELDIVHRDIKPDNVFLVSRPNGGSNRGGSNLPLVKLLDFGICRRLGMVVDYCTLTRAGHIIGSPEYMSPEQATGSRAIDMRVDLFAVGMVLFEALAGKRVHQGLSVEEIFVRLLRKGLPSLSSLCPTVPAALEVVITRATRRDPGERYATVTQFQHELLEARTAMRRNAFRRSSPSFSSSSSSSERSVAPLLQQPTSAPANWNVPTRQASLQIPLRKAS